MVSQFLLTFFLDILAMELIDNQMIVYSARDEGVILDSFKAVKNSSSYKMTISERKLQNPKIPLKFQNFKIPFKISKFHHPDVIDIKYDSINENVYYYSSRLKSIFKYDMNSGEMEVILQNMNISSTIQGYASEQILELDTEAGYLIAKSEGYKLIFIDLFNPRNTSSLVLDDQMGISYFKPFYNGNQEILILTENGFVKIFSYKDLVVEEIKSSDNLELEGHITAVHFNHKDMILMVNQFVRVSKKSYQNSIRVYKIKMNSWIWIEFLDEFSSKIYQSKIFF